ncbi:hypothetical protein ACMAUO_17785 [Gluconacetobacter sp. Hr-1-5]|uniref:hypothetical protein n=1 Tax=Gluconacetobacter sp. Hr-1-5 TaxID=3395370 RepID=UPI003B515BD9
MSQGLSNILSKPSGDDGLRLWLKSSGYTRRLLLSDGSDPWVGAAQYLAYFSQAQGLLRPDVAVIEVAELYASWLSRNPALKEAAAAKTRPSFGLRKLLDDVGPRQILFEVVEAVLANVGGRAPLVLALPSPRAWLRWIDTALGRNHQQIDDDAIEDASMYIADMVRTVSSQAIGGILIEEDAQDTALTPAGVELYKPLINVARHYRWPVVLRLAKGPVFWSDDVDAIISDEPVPSNGTSVGLDISNDLWNGRIPPRPTMARFYFVEVPTGHRPETVLESLCGLRALFG